MDVEYSNYSTVFSACDRITGDLKIDLTLLSSLV